MDHIPMQRSSISLCISEPLNTFPRKLQAFGNEIFTMTRKIPSLEKEKKFNSYSDFPYWEIYIVQGVTKYM